MAPSKRRLLERVVETYDRRGNPVEPDALEAACSVRPETLRRWLATFEECGLVVETDDGRYRPTVTAREFLDLELDADTFVVVDADRE